MKKTVSLVLALVIAAGCLCMASPALAAIQTMYVKTGNGKTLNVRDIATNEVIGRLDYGASVGVEQISGGWAFIVWGSVGSAKVMSKFLVSKDPGRTAPRCRTALWVLKPWKA